MPEPKLRDTLFTNEFHIRSDLGLVRRAIRENWPMTPEDRVWLWAKITGFRENDNLRIAKAASSVLALIQRNASA